MRRRINNDFSAIKTYLITGTVPEGVNPFTALDWGTGTSSDTAFPVYQQIRETLPDNAAAHRIYKGKIK